MPRGRSRFVACRVQKVEKTAKKKQTMRCKRIWILNLGFGPILEGVVRVTGKQRHTCMCNKVQHCQTRPTPTWGYPGTYPYSVA